MSSNSDFVIVNQIKIYPFSSSEILLDRIEQEKGILVAVNAEKILNATQETRQIINDNVGYCDGMGAVYAVRQKGYPDAVRIPGCDLWLEIIKRHCADWSFYLIGGRDEVIKAAVSKLKEMYPNLNIAGSHNGFFDEQEKEQIIEDIMTKKPNVVFVAMGSPKQELLMQQLKQRHDAIYQGLGGSFDVFSGYVKRAPKWWREHNLEFAYRVLSEPSRWKRLGPLIVLGVKLMFRRI